MKKKRLFSMLFTVLLCAVPLAGCSSGENEKTPAVTGEAGQEKNDGGGNPAPSGSPNDNAENPGSEDNAGGAGQEDSEDGSSAENKIEIVHTRDLSNPNATEKAQLIYDYLCSVTGNAVISGVQESPSAAGANDEINYIKRVSGKYPALRGFDYINDDFEGVNKRAEFWGNEMNGLVTICWHWGTPPDGIGYESSKGKIDLDKALTEGTELYEAMVAQMDNVAGYLKELQDKGIVVLWRPFHEFDGQWFWWGKGGNEKFIQLWQLMYDRYTNIHGLNNLIWVLGYSDQVKRDWYPGDEYVDIVGADSYKTGTRNALYKLVCAFGAEGMPVPLHECGAVPNPDELIESGTNWTWFMTWTLSNMRENNTKEELAHAFGHDYVITLEQLPDFDELLEAGES